MNRESKLELVLESFRRHRGRVLCASARELFEAPFAVLAQGTESPPILWYGNRRALELWEMTWEELTAMPARETAEPEQRQDRDRRLAEVARRGYVTDYAGVRISKTGRRFEITGATVWNIDDTSGSNYGQAAAFDTWRYLDPGER